MHKHCLSLFPSIKASATRFPAPPNWTNSAKMAWVAGLGTTLRVDEQRAQHAGPFPAETRTRIGRARESHFGMAKQRGATHYTGPLSPQARCTAYHSNLQRRRRQEHAILVTVGLRSCGVVVKTKLGTSKDQERKLQVIKVYPNPKLSQFACAAPSPSAGGSPPYRR